MFSVMQSMHLKYRQTFYPWLSQDPSYEVFCLFAGNFWHFLFPVPGVVTVALDGVCPAVFQAQPLHRGVSVLLRKLIL